MMRQKHSRTKSDEGSVDYIVIKLVLVRTAGPWAVCAGRSAALTLHKAHGLLCSRSKLKTLHQQQVVPGRSVFSLLRLQRRPCALKRFQLATAAEEAVQAEN